MMLWRSKSTEDVVILQLYTNKSRAELHLRRFFFMLKGFENPDLMVVF